MITRMIGIIPRYLHVTLAYVTLASPFVPVAPAQDKPGWDLVWSDEFNDPTVNLSKWSITNEASYVNGELEFYSDSPKNVFIDSGSLVLRALHENQGGKNYTSGKMTTRLKGDWLYGRFEVKAKLNKGKGMWPAIWMMPTDDAYGGWPSSGEMDIMELLGHDPARVYGTVHWNNNGHQQQGSSMALKSGTFADDYHVFAYEWEAGQQRWYVDDALYFTTNHGQPFDKRFYLILNVAVGGGWPGNPDGTTVFPNDMYVDYVRVYKKGEAGITTVASPPAMQISPNPFPDEAIITNGAGRSEIVLSDLAGRILERHLLASGEKSSLGKNLRKGVYVLRMNGGGQMRTERLFKSK